jgi:hypothetical protein
VAELIVDFEINIHKSIDEMMPGVDILGCFFHLAKVFKKKVDKKNMKKHYNENPEFRKFIKQDVGLSSLPLGDLEIGVKWLNDNVNFEDEEEASFKDYFMEYIEERKSLNIVRKHVFICSNPYIEAYWSFPTICLEHLETHW